MVGSERGVGFFVGVVHCRGVKAGFVDFDSRLEDVAGELDFLVASHGRLQR